MKVDLIFIGSKFIYNKPLQEYVIRKIEQRVDFLSSITFFKENDNSTFLFLEERFETSTKMIVVTTHQNSSTIGKLISTVTEDNQVLKEDMLMPQKSSYYKKSSYIVEYKETLLNVLYVDEMQEIPEILIDFSHSSTSIHLFEEDLESAKLMLYPIAQMYEVKVDMYQIVNAWIKIEVSSNKYGNISQFITSAKQLLRQKIIDKENIVKHIIDVLSNSGKKITFAESCTGGLLASLFTKESGVSSIFDGSLVTYSNELKESWLGIESEVIELNGAVSSQVVEEMSDGALNVSFANYAVSISGIAGEGGGTKEKPVGTVYIGVRTKERHIERRLHFNGDRNYIQQQSVYEAIKMLILIEKESFF